MAELIALSGLTGRWSDSRGSKYELTTDTCGTSLSVRTTRPDGVIRNTKGLIQLEPSTASGDVRIHWGKNYLLDTACLSKGVWPPDSIQWLKTNGVGASFVWTRVGSLRITSLSPRPIGQGAPGLGPMVRPAVGAPVVVGTAQTPRVVPPPPRPAAPAASATPLFMRPAVAAAVCQPLPVLPPNQQAARSQATIGRSRSPIALTGRFLGPPSRMVRPDQSHLPHPWEKHWDESYGIPYYWNSETDESLWEPPRGTRT